MLNIVLLILSACVGCILGGMAKAQAEGDGSTAVTVMLSFVAAILVIFILLVMIAFGASGDTSTAWRVIVGLVAYDFCIVVGKR